MLSSCPQCPNPRPEEKNKDHKKTKPQPNQASCDEQNSSVTPSAAEVNIFLPPLQGSLSLVELTYYWTAKSTEQLAKAIINKHNTIFNNNETLDNLNIVFNKLDNNLDKCISFCSTLDDYIENSKNAKNLLDIYSNTFMNKEFCETLIDIIKHIELSYYGHDDTKNNLVKSINTIFKMRFSTPRYKNKILRNFLIIAKETQRDENDPDELLDFVNYFNRLDVHSQIKLAKNPFKEPEERLWKKEW
ncbi:hypothetical protein AGMMS49921_08650 [Endomicrobiia bacterium]|nr:hypothetical protein AGMMS49921_08650 [Endomicrobiia bacterium]